MAAWLAYLKSRLLLPKPEDAPGDEPPAEDRGRGPGLPPGQAGRHAPGRRGAAEGAPQLGRDVFARGDPRRRSGSSRPRRFEGDLYAADGRLRRASANATSSRRYTPPPPQAYPLDDARERLRGLLPELSAWTPLTGVAPIGQRGRRAQPRLLPGLDAVGQPRAGQARATLEARQLEAFADIYLRAAPAA